MRATQVTFNVNLNAQLELSSGAERRCHKKWLFTVALASTFDNTSSICALLTRIHSHNICRVQLESICTQVQRIRVLLAKELLVVE